jgi:hypothetical protein
MPSVSFFEVFSSFSPEYISSSFICIIFYFQIPSLLFFDIFSWPIALFLTTYSYTKISLIALYFSSRFFYFSSCLPFLYLPFSWTTFLFFVTGSSFLHIHFPHLLIYSYHRMLYLPLTTTPPTVLLLLVSSSSRPLFSLTFHNFLYFFST